MTNKIINAQSKLSKRTMLRRHLKNPKLELEPFLSKETYSLKTLFCHSADYFHTIAASSFTCVEWVNIQNYIFKKQSWFIRPLLRKKSPSCLKTASVQEFYTILKKTGPNPVQCLSGTMCQNEFYVICTNFLPLSSWQSQLDYQDGDWRTVGKIIQMCPVLEIIFTRSCKI